MRIYGVPYAQLKSRGRVSGCTEWTNAVIRQTAMLPPVLGACRVRVSFLLPPDKYPADHPYGMDLDNLIKRFLDALQETVFRLAPGRDGCVTELEARKVKVMSADEAGAELEIALLA